MSKDLHAAIMNLNCDPASRYPSSQWSAYSAGHRDARHAAAELVLAAAPEQEPMFWVRLCGNGLYEGPIHNARIEEVRKKSGSWSPLYLKAPVPKERELTDAEIGRLWVDFVPDEIPMDSNDCAEKLLVAARGFARAVLAARGAR